ncbi:HlyD family type I secretion periplasmic adaptor subunit [Reyranella sp. CPCC 100927]|uniref:HlyD family type I secretion periplasmic adaptor subunit n=1 Tax=Reyranella sp. CPCC 100927 TaxID=2599616 RepID=UPI0011B41651|nr:HlyD family type I secretion periplasmic adaptor subunit [Reyranella sp. CPCC 100927]TWT13026.1 HlyD family type I secretion periplasmic adaptor subunit [Reyranella sp. CPCC 100927]
MAFEGLRRLFTVGRAALAEERTQPPPPRRSRDETEFLPAAVEVLETPASPTARAMFWSLSALLAVGLGWSLIGELDVVAIAEGKTVPTGKTKTIQPLEAGIVRAIHVQDGKTVKAGDVLIELDPTATVADARRLALELASARLELARLAAALAPDDPLARFQAPEGTPPAQADLQRTLLLNQVNEYRAKLAVLDAEVTKRRAEQATAEIGIAKLEQALPLLKERSDARDQLASTGNGSKLIALEVKQQLVEMRHELRALRQRREELAAGLEALHRQRQQTEAEYAKTVLGQRVEAERKIAGLEEELRKAEQRRDVQTLTAPIDGVVQQLAVHTLGGVVTPAQALMSIVPAEAKLEVEVQLANRDIGFVEAGQDVELKLETFMFTRYGTIPGKVLSISRDAVQDEKKGLLYPARIALLRSTIDVDGRKLPLGAGMALTAEIKTDHRTVIDYVLSPIRRYGHESLRER